MVNHGLAAELATDPLLLISLSGLFLYRKFTSSLSAGVRALAWTSFPGFSPTRLYGARERERTLLGLVTWLQNKINSEGVTLSIIILCLVDAMIARFPVPGVSWCCGNYCWLAFVLWCGYCSVSFQSFVLRHWCPQHQETTKVPQEQDRFANPTTITETMGNFYPNRTSTRQTSLLFYQRWKRKLALSQFNRRHQSLIKMYDLEFYTSVFISKGKSLYVKLAMKVSMFAWQWLLVIGSNQ